MITNQMQEEAERINKRFSEIESNPKTLSPDFIEQFKTQPVKLKKQL